MPELPTGTLTFLFTDIEGSTVRWEHFPTEMRQALARHDTLMRACLQRYGGIVFKTVGDAFYAVFSSAPSALAAAIHAQETLAQETWDEHIGQLRVRMALHTGEAEYRDNDYFGQTLNRVARILSAGHGEQILLSATTLGLVRATLPDDVVIQDLGTHHLKDIQLPEHIYQATIQHLRTTFPALKTLDLSPNNLPAQLTSFIGRTRDREAVVHLLQRADVRLITLVGPGGVGKTRLGMQVAADLAETFPHGLYFVDLAAIHDQQGIINALAQAIGIAKGEGHLLLEQVKGALRGKILLLLDNVEQVQDAPQLVRELLLDIPDITVLVTSRSVLHLAGEHEYRVRTFTAPQAQRRAPDLAELEHNEAISLFVQRARAIKTDFCLTQANAHDIIEICQQLDGLPLAIELAAARVNLLPPHAMVKRLGQRLRLLHGQDQHRSTRHQTLRETIEWSYHLLNAAEEEFFQQLAIFRKGCTLEAAEYVCQLAAPAEYDPLDILHSLVDKSLLRLRENEEGEPRFEMLYTMREFALEHQREETLALLRHRHAEYYADLMQRFKSLPAGSEQKHWLTRLEVEYENMLDALHWCSTHGNIEDGFHLAEALSYFWWVRGRLHEGQHWFEALFHALKRENQVVSDVVKAKVLERASVFACSQDDFARAQAWAEESLSLSQQLDEKEIMSKAYVALANVALRQDKFALASTHLEESVKLRQIVGDVRGMAGLLNNLGNMARQERNFARAALLHERSLGYFRQLEDDVAVAAVLNNLAEVEWCRDRRAQALALYTESLQLSRTIHYSWGIASSLVGLGDGAFARAEYEEAKHLYKESLHLFQEMDDRAGITTCLENLTTLLKRLREQEEAQEVEVVGYNIDSSLSPISTTSTIENLRAELGDQLFNALRTAGHIPSMEASILDAFKDI